MKESFRRSMAWLHTWAGLTFCWILYFMFVTGTLGYFDTEIDHWMEAESPAPQTTQSASVEQNLSAAVGWLSREAEGADSWFIALPDDRNEPHLRTFWRAPPPEEEGEERKTGNDRLDSITGEPLAEAARDTGGGQALYRMHYALHYIDGGAAFRFIGIVALFMFIGLVTGVVIHRKIFADMFTFRGAAPAKRAWLDAHNLLSVASLPFQLMITYSGLLFTVTTWMPAIALGSYGFNIERAAEALRVVADVQVERTGEPAELAPLMPIVADAASQWGGEDAIRGLDVRMPGDAAARVSVSRKAGIGVIAEQRVYDGVTGQYLETLDPTSRAPIAAASVMLGLHEGLYAGALLRWFYFISGLLGAGMVATGAIYWSAKRRRKSVADADHSRGFRFVEAMNIGTILGLPIAIAAYFWSNRLLPLGLEGRPDWEMHCLFITWGLCLLYPLTRPRLAAWRELAWLGAGAFAALPVINAATTEVHLINSLRAGDWVLASFDLTALAFGLIFALTAKKIGGRADSAERLSPAPQPTEATAA
ncbi:MAG: PepSY-associated TM helix domain-containing protein [Acidobacteriota bacterium]